MRKMYILYNKINNIALWTTVASSEIIKYLENEDLTKYYISVFDPIKNCAKKYTANEFIIEFGK